MPDRHYQMNLSQFYISTFFIKQQMAGDNDPNNTRIVFFPQNSKNSYIISIEEIMVLMYEKVDVFELQKFENLCRKAHSFSINAFSRAFFV